jgi:hypothetical protein
MILRNLTWKEIYYLCAAANHSGYKTIPSKRIITDFKIKTENRKQKTENKMKTPAYSIPIAIFNLQLICQLLLIIDMHQHVPCLISLYLCLNRLSSNGLLGSQGSGPYSTETWSESSSSAIIFRRQVCA